MLKRRHAMVSQEATAVVTVDKGGRKSKEQMTKEARMVFETFTKEVLNYPHVSAPRNNPILVEGIDNYYLLCDDRPVSITELPLSIGGAAVRQSENAIPIHLLGQTRSGVGLIKLRAEMWKLWALGRNFGPRISVRTPNGWTRLYNPRPVYRKIMNDGLTLVHLLHCIEGNRNVSAVKIKKYLEEEFRKHEERPSMHKLHTFYSAVKTYLLKESEEKRNGILSDLFPEQFYLESFAPEIDRDRSAVSPCLDQGHEKLENFDEEFETSEFRQQDLDSDDYSTPDLPKLIAGIESTRGIFREIFHSQNGDHKFLERDVYELSPQSTRHLAPCIPYLSSSDASDEALEAANELQRQKRKVDILEQSKSEIVIQEDSEEELTNCKPKKKRSEQPIENKIEGKTFKPDRNAKLDDPPICIICDDGGDLLYCEGPCQRYFHAVGGVTGRESYCETLGLTRREVQETSRFRCKNCQFENHQCFVCGELGTSAASSILGNQQVFLCRSSACRRYYHPECVARALVTTPNWKTLAEKIQSGQQGFQCPRHCCHVCQIEELNPGDLVQCRRCPKAWHLDCLQDYDFSNEPPDTQVWTHYKRQFIFCKDHTILPCLQTPVRDHIRFPES